MRKYEPIYEYPIEVLTTLLHADINLYYQGINDSCNKDGFGLIPNSSNLLHCKKIKNIWTRVGYSVIEEVLRSANDSECN